MTMILDLIQKVRLSIYLQIVMDETVMVLNLLKCASAFSIIFKEEYITSSSTILPVVFKLIIRWEIKKYQQEIPGFRGDHGTGTIAGWTPESTFIITEKR